MAKEIVLLSAVREHNRRLWLRTFPFHFGIYLTTVAVALALLAGVVHGTFQAGFEQRFGGVVRQLVLWLGVTGFSIGGIGAAALMYRRLTLPELRRYTVPADVLNLALFVIAFSSGLLTWGLADTDARQAMAFAANLVALRWDAPIGHDLASLLPNITVAVFSLLLAYIPFTHMSHFVGKYFAYHAIRWNDTPNLGGIAEEASIRRLLASRVSWAAPHIQGHGTKTWAELASTNPTESKP